MTSLLVCSVRIPVGMNDSKKGATLCQSGAFVQSTVNEGSAEIFFVTVTQIYCSL